MKIKLNTLWLLWLFIASTFLITCQKHDKPDNNHNTVVSYEQAYPNASGELVEITLGEEIVTCELINGEYIFQGDILLQPTTKGSAASNKDRWPNNTVYYEIDPNLYNKSELPDQSRITVAIQEIEYNTNIRFVKHTTESNYVKFIYNANGCSSSVGMIGGMQKIRLADWATKGNVIHEICHALGLLHEHSKPGRDKYVTIVEDNIKLLKKHNFNEVETAMPNTPEFDFESIMLYGSYTTSAFAKNPQWAVILKKVEKNDPDSIIIPQRERLTTRDLQILNVLYPDKPTVVTLSISDITKKSAVCGGNITKDGGYHILQKGVCWSTSQNPTIANSKTTDGTGLGTYTSNITGLSPNTTYYVRAYATNAEGTAYGNQQSFKTKEDPDDSREPTVTTKNVSNITQTTATCGGNVTDAGSSKVTARGVCWDTSKNPTKSDSKTTDGSGTGSYTSQLTGLQSNCKYYVRAYATNSEGTSYGDQISFYTKASGKSVTPSNSCSSAPIIDPYTTYNVNINVGDYDLAPPIETHSYGSANVRGFWIAFRTISDWGPDHDVKIFNVSNNFDPVFGIRNACISPYLAHFSNNYYGYMDKNGKGGDETSDTNLPGSASGANLDDLYYVRIYHYVGSETPSITFSIRVE